MRVILPFPVAVTQPRTIEDDFGNVCPLNIDWVQTSGLTLRSFSEPLPHTHTPFGIQATHLCRTVSYWVTSKTLLHRYSLLQYFIRCAWNFCFQTVVDLERLFAYDKACKNTGQSVARRSKNKATDATTDPPRNKNIVPAKLLNPSGFAPSLGSFGHFERKFFSFRMETHRIKSNDCTMASFIAGKIEWFLRNMKPL